MLDAIETDRAAVDERDLIQRLNISMPFSPTYGNVRHDQNLVPIIYKGMRLYGKLRSSGNHEFARYWFQLRGSLIKFANNGLHNTDFKDPFEILYALDELVMRLRIDPFRTPLNGLELSTTIRTEAPEQVCFNIVSYLNRLPCCKTISRNNVELPYTEIEAMQHKLKLYAPQANSLRVELKVDKMQFLNPHGPQTFADLVQPHFAAPLSNKLLNAFNKVVWKCPNINVNRLTEEERNLYLMGLEFDYWQVSRNSYSNETDFKRAEKQQSRRKKQFKEIVLRHWQYESPLEIERRLREQLVHYSDLMHTRLYQVLLEICLNRWQHVGNLPGFIRVPKHLFLPPLSEIYPLYLGKFPTSSNCSKLPILQHYPHSNVNSYKPQENIELFPDYLSFQAIHPQQNRANSRQLSRSRTRINRRLTRAKEAINMPGGLQYSLNEVEHILSARTRIALAYTMQSLSDLTNDPPF